MKVLVAPDSFKGSLDASGVAKAIFKGLVEKGIPQADILIQPLADGGEGTAQIVGESMGMERMEMDALDPIGRPCHTAWYCDWVKNLAIMDMASASGLGLLSAAERDPLKANTLGTGNMLSTALDLGIRHIWLGLGGSATCDMALGALTSLGFQLLDEHGGVLSPFPVLFSRIKEISRSQSMMHAQITYLYDVDVPLLGTQGSIARYAPQKGASEEQQALLEKGFRNVCQVLESMARDVGHHPGDGAAGGMGFGLRTLLGAEGKPGFYSVAEALGLEQLIAQSDWVIGGEGRIDAQTLDGKVVHGLADMCRAHQKPLLLVAGSVKDGRAVLNSLGARHIHSMTEMGISFEKSMAAPQTALKRAGHSFANYIIQNHDN